MTTYTLIKRAFTFNVQADGDELDTDVTETWHARPRVLRPYRIAVIHSPGYGWSAEITGNILKMDGTPGTQTSIKWMKPDRAPQWVHDLVAEVLA